ncbi:hypothetical protein CsSME_00046762 [Camellia sinensis var. sinensis]
MVIPLSDSSQSDCDFDFELGDSSCGVRLCGFGTLRLLRSVRSELCFAGDLLKELGAGVELATTTVPHLFLPLACATNVAKLGRFFQVF